MVVEVVVASPMEAVNSTNNKASMTNRTKGMCRTISRVVGSGRLLHMHEKPAHLRSYTVAKNTGGCKKTGLFPGDRSRKGVHPAHLPGVVLR